MHGMDVYVAAIVFILTYALIITEKLERTVVALLGAAVMVGLKILTQETAIEMIDFNTLGLLIGMMMIVAITKQTGLFQFLAITAAKWAKGDPWRIILALATITAGASALLDNVTTVLLVVPVTLVITETLEMNPIPFLVPEILASNIGGAATLIGDPPNIMIGSATKLGFTDFLTNLGPVILIVYVAVMLVLKFVFGRDLQVKEALKQKIMRFDGSKSIKDQVLLKKSLFVLGLTIAGFTLHESLGLESASIALMGAALLLAISGVHVDDIVREVEWPTIFFFLGLFILVGGLEEVGIINALASKIVALTGGNLPLTAMMVLWISAIASAFIDNIPFVATMIPLIKGIAAMSALNVIPLWWALSLGACLGGNGTLVGASANVIVAGMLQKTKHRLTFAGYLRVGFPIMLLSIAMSSIYLWARYLR